METLANIDSNASTNLANPASPANPVNPFSARLAGESERDWRAYTIACREISLSVGLDSREMLALKQARALAYLGKRAQNEGGVYSKTRARVLTPEFVQSMSKYNTALRYKRYPWLERLLALLDEIDQVQDQLALKGSKVLSIMSLKPQSQIQIQTPLNS